MKIKAGRRKAASFVALTALVLSALVPMTAIADESEDEEVVDPDEEVVDLDEDDGSADPLGDAQDDQGDGVLPGEDVVAIGPEEAAEEELVESKGPTPPQRQGETSDAGVTPEWKDDGPGGNFSCPAGFSDTGGDAPGQDWSALDALDSVTVSGKFVSFEAAENYSIFGAIVKGGPFSNFYEYEEGIASDSGLTAPINTNQGDPYGVSNLRFCYRMIDTPTSFELELQKLWFDEEGTPTTPTEVDDWSLEANEVDGDNLITLPANGDFVATATVASGTTYTVDENDIEGWDEVGCETVQQPGSPAGTTAFNRGAPFTVTGDTTHIVCNQRVQQPPEPETTVTVNKLWEFRSEDGGIVTPTTPTAGTVDFGFELSAISSFEKLLVHGSDGEPEAVTGTVTTTAPDWTGSTTVDLPSGQTFALVDIEEVDVDGVEIEGCLNPSFQPEYPELMFDRSSDSGQVAASELFSGPFRFTLEQGDELTVTVTNVVTCEEPETPTGNGGGIITTVTPDPDPEEYFVAFEKIWDLPDDFEDFGDEADLSVSFAFDGEDLAEGEEFPVELDTTYDIGEEAVTGLSEFCEVVESDLPEDFTTPAEAEDGDVFTITVTNTVECAAEVLGIDEEQPEQPELPEVIEETPAVEVLGVTVEDDSEEMPKTGASALFLTLLGLLGLGLGGGLLGRFRRTEG